MHVGIAGVTAFVDATRETAKSLLKDANTYVYIARGGEEMLGYISFNIHPALHLNGKECVVRELYVREEYRRQGIGKGLIDYVERFARRSGATRLSLATNWDNPDQNGFYEACGFTRRCDFAVKYFV